MRHATFLLTLLVAAVCRSADAALSSQYARSKEIKSGTMSIYWNISGDSIALALEASATGWVAFGLGETKGMAGADIVYYEAASSKLVDSHAVGNTKPIADLCQDWSLVKAEQMGGKLTVHISRKLLSSDKMDRNFTDDAAYPLMHTSVIAAWGNSAGIDYHTSSGRASAGVRFFGTSDIGDALALLKGDSSVQTKDVLSNNFPVPTTETTYHEVCYDVGTLLGVSDASKPYHIVAFEALIKPETKKYLHHYTVYGVTTAACPGSLFGYEKGPLIWPWGPGQDYTILPPKAGIRVLGAGFKSLVLQIHYDNVDGDTGKVDTSGFRIYYTSSLRQHDAGVLQLGDPSLKLARTSSALPNGNSYIALSISAAACTNAFTDDAVTVFTRFLHMHQAGARMKTTQFRDGKTLREDAVDFYDFKQAGAFEPRSTGAGFSINKGDSFLVECWYSVAPGLQKRFGLGSAQEMCIDFIYYYPLQTSVPDSNQCHFESKEGKVPAAVEVTGINRVFSSQPATCPDGKVLPPPPPPYTTVAKNETSESKSSLNAPLNAPSWSLHLVSATTCVLFYVIF